MSTWKEMAAGYYPRLWGRERIEALVDAGRLTRDEANEIMAETGEGEPMVMLHNTKKCKRGGGLEL